MDGPVLVVEDFELDFETASRGFRQAGLTGPILHAATAEKATDLLKEIKPVMILLDLALPDGSGFEILEAVRASSSLRDVPVAVWSGVYAADRAHLAYDAGADWFFTKRPHPEAQGDIEMVVDTLVKPARELQPMRRKLESTKFILSKARELADKLRATNPPGNRDDSPPSERSP